MDCVQFYGDMNINFSNTTVMHLCNIEEVMLSACGAACANLLKMRLHQLFAADYLGIFAPPGSKPLRCVPYCAHNDAEIFQLPLKDNFILVFEAVDGDILDAKGSSDWNTIKTIMIHSIEKITHD